MNVGGDEPIATTRAGRLRGFWADGAATFLGIPYAAAPVGALRFLSPQPAASWSGVRDALSYGATPPQPYRPSTLIPEPTIDGDDYLNLNVFTPDLSPAHRSVLVWIHGGGFFAGGNVSPWYRGATFAKHGIVVVSINYRLGIEGFMPIEGAPSNRGVRDWIAALEWVRDNIEAFGGDPGEVTIAGQSAGGMACATLLAVPRARGLFRRAMLMSGSIALGASAAVETTDFIERFEASLGAPATRAALGAVSPARLIEAQVAASGGDGENGPPRQVAAGFARGLVLKPQVDGDLLPLDPGAAIRGGASADVAVVAGATQEEFYFVIKEADAEDAAAALPGFLRDEARIERFRRGHPGASPKALIGQAISDFVFRAPALRLGELRAKAPAPTFLYDFRWRPREGLLGPCHCLDIPFAFDCLEAEQVAGIAGAAPPRTLASLMHGAWISFIKTGDPGWPAYSVSDRRVMIFDAQSRVEADAMRLEREVWLSPERS
jgi:para-nitrobenzyl esterase